jgi:hypothetical protein
MQPKKKTVSQNPEAEFYQELAERYAYWINIRPEYAAAYKHMLCAFTTPEEKEVKKN